MSPSQSVWVFTAGKEEKKKNSMLIRFEVEIEHKILKSKFKFYINMIEHFKGFENWKEMVVA